MKRKKYRDERLSIEKQYSKPGGVMIMHTGKSEIFKIPEKAFRAETEGRINVSKDDGAIAVCPHCKTKWVWSDDNWFTAIKLHGGHCQCPDNWKCTICNGKIFSPADFAEYEKNGAHAECSRKEMEIPMMKTDAILDGNDYTIYFELDNESDISVDRVIRDKDGQDVWGAEWFIDEYGDAVLAECKQFLNENL